MSGYEYQVPVFAGSPWDNGVVPVPETPLMYQAPGTIRQINDPDRPRVGIYCPHDDDRPWLVGSFTVSAYLWLDLDPAKWAWQRMWAWHLEWLTGDGVLFPLFGVPQRSLVATEVIDPPSGRLRLTTTADGQVEPQFEAEVDVRHHLEMRCPICSQQGSPHRLENVQATVTTLWHKGFREISLAAFERIAN